MGAWKNLPLQEFHQELEAKMVPFSSWSVPQQYPGGAQAEHRHVRSECGLFDFSCTGAFQISGPGSAETLDFLLARRVSSLETGAVLENCLLSEKGGVLDLLTVCRMEKEDFLIIGSPGNIESDAAWFSSHLPTGAALRDLSADLAHFSLQGPKAAGVLMEFGTAAETLPACGRRAILDLDGIRCIVCGSNWSGESGFELFFNGDNAPALFEELLSISPVRPAGFGASETLRIEMGHPAFGSELSPRYSPIESGLEKMVSLREERGIFLGKDALLTSSPGCRLTGVLLPARNAARSGDAVLNAEGNRIGTVTSGAFCPTLERAAALCRIQAEFCAAEGDQLFLECGSTREQGTVTELPFLKKTNAQ